MMTFDKVTLTTACNWDDEYFDWLNVTRSRVLKKTDDLPKEYYINEKKKAVVLKWDDDSITKVKTSKDDKFDTRYGFLIAYFQKHCGLSKTQANKYLDNLQNNLEKDKKEK